MKSWEVRLHLTVEAESAEEARDLATQAGERLADRGEGSDAGEPRLLSCCVDNEAEARPVGEEGGPGLKSVFLLYVCHSGGQNPRLASVRKSLHGAQVAGANEARRLGLIDEKTGAPVGSDLARGIVAEEGELIVYYSEHRLWW